MLYWVCKWFWDHKFYSCQEKLTYFQMLWGQKVSNPCADTSVLLGWLTHAHQQKTLKPSNCCETVSGSDTTQRTWSVCVLSHLLLNASPLLTVNQQIHLSAAPSSAAYFGDIETFPCFVHPIFFSTPPCYIFFFSSILFLLNSFLKWIVPFW